MMIAIEKKTGRCTSCAAAPICCATVDRSLSRRESIRTMFSVMTMAPSTIMPKSSAPSDRRFAGMWRRLRQIAANVAEKHEEDDRHENDAFRQVVHHRVCREVEEVAAIEMRHDLHAGRQKAIVQLPHFRVDRIERRVRVRPFSQQHDAGDDIVVVEDAAVDPMDGLAELTEPDLGAFFNRGDVAYAQRRSVLRRED